MKLKTTLLLLLVSSCLIAMPGEKPVIALRVHIADDLVLRKYSAIMPIADLERRLGDRFAKILSDTILIFQFDTQKAAPDVLTINLWPSDNSQLHDLNFKLKITGRHSANTQDCNWPCVSLLSFSGFLKDDPEYFINSVAKKFKENFQQQDFISKQLGWVTIENFASPNFTEKKWSLNCTHREINIGPPSSFKVIQLDHNNDLLSFMSQVVSRDIDRKIRLRPIQGQGFSDPNEFNAAKCVKLEGIQVIQLYKMVPIQPNSNLNNR